MRVLIVEDQALLALLLEQDLVDEGHQVVGIATTAPQALFLARENAPDLALLDVQLADGDTGIDLARDLVARALKVVFVTGSPHLLPPDGAGAVGVLTKPYAPQILRRTLAYIAHLLGTGQSAEAPRELRRFSPAN